MSEQEFVDQINKNKGIIHKACEVYCKKYPRQDLIQEITLEAWRSLNNFKNYCNFSTWLYTIAKNKCIDILRRQKKAPSIVGLEEYAETLTEVNNAPELVKQLKQAMRYTAVLSTIEEPLRTLFELYMEGLTYEEISSQSGIDENLLRQWVHRIKQRLYLRYGKSENIKN